MAAHLLVSAQSSSEYSQDVEGTLKFVNDAWRNKEAILFFMPVIIKWNEKTLDLDYPILYLSHDGMVEKFKTPSWIRLINKTTSWSELYRKQKRKTLTSSSHKHPTLSPCWLMLTQTCDFNTEETQTSQTSQNFLQSIQEVCTYTSTRQCMREIAWMHT